MSNIIVLGAGMVGSAMALDLVKNHTVTVTDLSQAVLDKVQSRDNNLQTQVLDVTEIESVKRAILPFDLVVCAVPGFLGFNTLKAIIESKKDVVDISFFPENALELDALAKQHGVTAIVDCGVAPGMDNIILGYYDTQLKVTDFECLVGGLPKQKKWPFNYKAPFSPIDVIEEYTRPARYVENGQIIVREPLTDCEYVEFDNIGTLESFNSDGLRSIIETMPHIPNMKEKTLRYPGHVEYIKVLKETGFFSIDSIQVNGVEVKPIQFTSQLLFKEWKLGEEEPEITVMRVTVKGYDNNIKSLTIQYDLYDEYDETTKTSSMARCTGYTATAAANMVLQGLFKSKGVFPPELIGKHKDCFTFILEYLAERGVRYNKTTRVD
ncbi:MAG: lysine 6-dehydrogenase [bacterium]|jgi:lysine 6-dehydrogenase